MNIQEKIKELKEEIEKERSKRPIRCYAEAIKYGGNQDNENVKILQAQLSAYEEISTKLADFEKKLDEFWDKLVCPHCNYAGFNLRPDNNFDELKNIFREEVFEEKKE